VSEAGFALEADAIENVPPPESGQPLVGHSEVYARLSKQIANNRLPGAILLHGPRGIGKATLAFALTREILQQTGDQNRDQVREQVAGGAHPNLFVLRKKPRDGVGFYSFIRVEDVRAIIHKLQQTRGSSGHRICIVDAIDDCNVQSANALLKLLEEPPAQSHFILISHRPGGLLPTIRSRCQSQAMRTLSGPEMEKVLQNCSASAQHLAQATALAFGRPRRAFEALTIADNEVLLQLSEWLKSSGLSPDINFVSLAENLSAKKNGMEESFGREMLRDWIAEEAKAALANTGALSPQNRTRLASANELWDKANSLFSNADSYNLDKRQTLISLFDAIKSHSEQTRFPANIE